MFKILIYKIKFFLENITDCLEIYLKTKNII